MKLSKDEGRREIIFQMTMTAARKMLEANLISRDQYEQFNTTMQQKYKPVFGSLLTDINLL